MNSKPYTVRPTELRPVQFLLYRIVRRTFSSAIPQPLEMLTQRSRHETTRRNVRLWTSPGRASSKRWARPRFLYKRPALGDRPSLPRFPFSVRKTGDIFSLLH